MKLYLYLDDQFNKIINNINYHDHIYEYQDDANNKIIIDNELIFTRETSDFLFKLVIGNNSYATYLLKDNNINLDINVLKASYNHNNEELEMEYLIESSDEIIKIKIVKED